MSDCCSTSGKGTAASAILMSEAAPVLVSTITCPACGHQQEETMPTDACLYFYECAGCGTLLKPLPGHCCVFCSFGSVVCPPMQQPGACGSCAG